MSNGVNLPPEIIEDILYRIPAKSLGRFRCVSKPWRSLISQPQFIRTHLNQNSHRERVILISEYQSLYSFDLDNTPFDNNDAFARKLDCEHPDQWEEISCSCNGLVLAANEDDKMFLLNPTTGESKILPISPFALDPRFSEIMYGLGYDSSTDDYKVVTISYYDPESEYKPNSSDMFVDVYTLKTDCWRRLQNSPYDHSDGIPLPGVFVNGSLHWLASRVSDYSWAIATFNLEDENFGEAPLPNLLDVEKNLLNDIIVLGGCLCVLVFPGDSLTYVWMMKEYGMKESWTKFSIYEPNLFSIKPLRFLGDQEVLLDNEGEGLVVYNVVERTLRHMVVHGITGRFDVGGTFVESLVSPKCGNGIEG